MFNQKTTVEITVPFVAGIAEFQYANTVFKVSAPMNVGSITVRLPSDYSARQTEVN